MISIRNLIIKISKVMYTLVILFTIIKGNYIFAQDIDNKKIADSYNIENVISLFNSYIDENNIKEFDANLVFNELIESNGKVNDNIIKSSLNFIFEQINTNLKEVLTIFLIIVLSAILNNIELDENSEVTKITKLVIYISLSSILIKNYISTIVVFKEIINKLTTILQTVSTFLIGVVVAIGKVSSSTVIESSILCISNIVCYVVDYIVIPCFSVSIVVNIISKISDNIKLTSLSTLFRKSSLYIFITMIGIMLSVLKLETTITSSMDSLTYKTAQDVVSNVVPVVGGFLSDSLDTVISSTKFIGKVGGVFSIICTGIIVLNPIIKILSIVIVYSIIIAISEPINGDKNIQEILSEFVKLYKDILGIIIGVMVVFVISTAVIMAIIGNIGG